MIVGEPATSADCDPVGPSQLRQAEVQHLHHAVRAHLDVRRLQVAVDDPLLVRGLERLGDLFRDRQRIFNRDRAAIDALRQVLPLDQLHHECVQTSRSLDRVDRGYMWMVEGCEGPRLALESRKAVGVGRERVRQDLDRHLPPERRVRRPIDLAHTARADLAGDFVDAES